MTKEPDKIPPANESAAYARDRGWPMLVSSAVSPAILALTLGLVAPAAAEMVATPATPPFSASDQAILQVLDSKGAFNPAALTPPSIERLLVTVAEIQRRNALNEQAVAKRA